MFHTEHAPQQVQVKPPSGASGAIHRAEVVERAPLVDERDPELGEHQFRRA